jgi:hypothetical protein
VELKANLRFVGGRGVLHDRCSPSSVRWQRFPPRRRTGSPALPRSSARSRCPRGSQRTPGCAFAALHC